MSTTSVVRTTIDSPPGEQRFPLDHEAPASAGSGRLS
jgi:hypothetical protein